MTDEKAAAAENISTPQKTARVFNNPLIQNALVLLLFFIIILLRFWPLFQNFDQYVFTGRGINFHFWHWRTWIAVKTLQAFLHDHPFNLIKFLYNGVLANSGFPVSGNVFDLLFISYPLSRLMPFPQWFNVKVILILLFNGWAGWFAVKKLVKNQAAAFVAGLFLMLNPYVFLMVNVARLRAAVLGFMILYLVYMYENSLKPTLKGSMKAGAFLVFSGLIYWFSSLFMLWITVLFLVCKVYLIKRKNRNEKIGRFLFHMLVPVVMLGFVLLLFGLPYLLNTVSLNQPDLKFGIPFPSMEEIKSRPVGERFNRYNYPWDAVDVVMSDSLPWTFIFAPAFLLAAVIALFTRRKPAVFLLILFILFTLLSWGPYLRSHWDEQKSYTPTASGKYISLPWQFFYRYVPPVARLQHPNRFASVSAVILALLGGIGAAFFLERKDKLKYGGYLLILLMALSALPKKPSEAFDPAYPEIRKIPIPALYSRLGEDADIYGIIEVPIGTDQDLYGFYQTIHEKRLYDGWTSGLFPQKIPLPDGDLRQICKRDDEIADNALILYLRDWQKRKAPHKSDASVNNLAYEGYRYIIVHEKLFPWEKEREPTRSSEKKGLNPAYLKVKEELTEKFGPPEVFMEINQRFGRRGIPPEVEEIPCEASLFRIDDR